MDQLPVQSVPARTQYVRRAAGSRECLELAAGLPGAENYLAANPSFGPRCRPYLVKGWAKYRCPRAFCAYAGRRSGAMMAGFSRSMDAGSAIRRRMPRIQGLCRAFTFRYFGQVSGAWRVGPFRCSATGERVIFFTCCSMCCRGSTSFFGRVGRGLTLITFCFQRFGRPHRLCLLADEAW